MYKDFLLDEFTDFSWKIDKNGIYTYVSGEVEKIMGYSHNEIIGKTPFDFMPKDEAEKISKIFQNLSEEKSLIKNLENWATSKTGERICWLTNGKPVFDENNNFNGYAGVDKDITKSKLLEENLKNQEELLFQQSRMAQMGEMLTMIAHQWNQPLASISSVISGIQLNIALDVDLSTQEAQEKYQKELLQKTDNMQEYIQHLSNTLYDFRNFFSPNKKQTATTLKDLCEKSLSIIKPLIQKQNIHIEKQCESFHTVQTYNTEMIQVFLNIFKNILSNFEEKQTKEPVIKVHGSQHSIYIEDNGGGINPNIIDKIFEPYFTTKDETHGTGLGLYMSKIIVEEHHHGKIEVRNTDQGARFKISLPTS